MVSKQMLEQVLRELQPLCTAEQQFLEKFFQLSQDAADLQVLEVSVRMMSSPVPSVCPPLQRDTSLGRRSRVAAFLCCIPELSWALVLQQLSAVSAAGKLKT